MRVITGSARGRRLKEPADMEQRPTTDKVKESLFNIIQFDVEGRKVLDLFAGTGQLGIEALSRGAESVLFVDCANKAIALVNENLERTGLKERATVLRADWKEALLRNKGKFDIIFLDPPYDTDMLKNALHAIAEIDILSCNGIIACESRADAVLPALAAPYEMASQHKYGKIMLTIYTRKESSEE